MIYETLPSKVTRFEAIIERLCYIQISMPNYDLIIINYHASSENKQDEVKNEFYEELEQVYAPQIQRKSSNQ